MFNKKTIEISLDHLSKSYGDRVILSDLNYTFNSNFCYIIQGKSGIGKTTLLNIISGYLRADSGNVHISKNTKIDYMFQEEMLFSNLSVIENLTIKYYADSHINKWNVEKVKTEYIDILELFKIENLLECKIYELSGGEKQRVILASMIVSKAQILLIDEPITNLDEENRVLIQKIIESCIPNRIIIVVSHIEMNIKNNVKKLILKNGELYEQKESTM